MPSSRTIAFYVLQSGPLSWTPDSHCLLASPFEYFWDITANNRLQMSCSPSFLLSIINNSILPDAEDKNKTAAHYPFVLCPVSLMKCQSFWCFACLCFLKLNCLQPKRFFPSVVFFWGGRGVPLFGSHLFLSSIFPSHFSGSFLSLQYNSMNTGFLFVFFKDASRVLGMAFSMKMT